MSNYLGTPKVQFFDLDGDPLNAGLVYTYEPGTTKNKATYPSSADAFAATNPNDNPVVLDSRGEANIVLSGRTKIVVTDSVGNVIGTMDDVGAHTSSGTITDSDTNELLDFTGVASAVNFLTITNAATSNAPSITAAGTDTNIGINIDTKGTGTLTLGSQDTPVVIDSDTINLKTGGSSRVDINDSGLRLNGANTRVTTILDEDDMSSNSATALATQQSIKAYLDNNVSHARGTVSYSGGTPTLRSSSGVGSITDTGVGILTVNYSTNFADSNNSVSANAYAGAARRVEVTHNSSNHVATVTNTSGTASDPYRIFFSAYGNT